jgi:Type I restriction enzyme R protein N terminus (HSDR_N)
MVTVLPDDFNFAALDSPTFKEDAVREEIVAPILRALGYRPTGDVRVERGKPLKHPFVMLGTTKRNLSLVPDYLLYKADRSLAVLDAKAPDEPIVNSVHVEQAYSYAIHPEVRCGHFGLCNGRELIVWDVASLEPVLRISAREINKRWGEVQKALLPEFLEKPFKREFRTDFGVAAQMTNLDLTTTALIGFHVDMIGRVDDATLTATCGAEIGGMDFMASFDMPASLLPELLACLPTGKRQEVNAALARAPFCVLVDGKIQIDVGAKLGVPTQGEHESFIPLLVTDLLKATYAADFQYPKELKGDVPSSVYRL